jgi:hypothetical protein
MRRFLYMLVVSILTALPAFSQTTTITATHLAQDVSGTLLASGKLCFLPINQQGVPTGFELSGIQYAPQQACFNITAGAISGVALPDTALLSPTGVGYLPTIEDATGKPLYTYTQPIYPTGTTFSLDTWSPTASAVIQNPATVQYGVNAPVGRCGVNPALYYTAANLYTCQLQVWVVVTGSGGGGTVTSSQITTALGFLPVTATQLASAISTAIAAIPAVTSSSITTAIGYTPANVTALANYLPLAGGSLAGALLLIDGSPAASQAYVATLISGSSASPTTTPVFSLAGGTYMAAESVALSDTTSGATISYCANLMGNCTPNTAYSSALSVNASETICADALGGSGGVLSSVSCNTYTINTGVTTPTGTGIGTIIAQSYLTNGSVAYKTCSAYPGAICAGGVGAVVPSTVPTHTFGLNTPSASTGVSNSVGTFNLQTSTPGASGTTFTEALWTTTGGGVGNNPTATNFYVDGWIKESYPAGPSRIEFDTYAFDSGWDWMYGTQCNSDKNLIQTDNQNQPQGWVYTSVPCGKLYDGNYHHIQQTFHRTLGADRSCAGGTAPCQYWDTITIDGTSYAINAVSPATTSGWSGSGWQFQIDGAPTSASGGSPAIYNLWVDSGQFIAGTAAATSSPGGGGGTTAGTGDLDSFNFDSGTSVPAGLTAVGSPVVVATKDHSTPNSAHFPSGSNYYTDTISPVMTIYSRQYVYINTESGTLPCTFLRYYHGGAEMFVYYFSTSGTVSYFDQASGASITAGPGPLTTGAWHYIETYTKIDPTAGHVTVKIDGTQTYDSGPINTGTTTIDTTWFGNIGNTAPTGWDTYQDNVDLDDSGWIGPI